MFLARVRVSSHFPVLDCISYSCARRRSWLSLVVRVSSQYFTSFGLYIIQLRKKEIVALAVVRVSIGYFSVFECISYSTQEGRRVSR